MSPIGWFEAEPLYWGFYMDFFLDEQLRGCCCTSLPHNYRKSYPVLLTRTECSLTRLTSTLCLIRAIIFLFLFGQLDRDVSKGTNLIKNI